MKPLHSSISSSDAEAAGRTLLAWPWPTPAFWYAAATVLAAGLVLGHVGGWSHGAPASSLHLDVAARAYLFNAENRPRKADVLLLGDSLMELGVIPEKLAEGLGLEAADVKNLGLAGARPWDVEWLVERLQEPETSGPRLAVLQVDRTWFDLGWSPVVNYGRYKALQDPEALARLDILERSRARAHFFLPERRQMRSWLTQVRYDWLAYLRPGLVPAPKLVPPEIWDLPPEAQRRAVGRVDTQARGAIAGAAFADHALSAIRMTVGTLKRRSYRVVLFLAPLRGDALALIGDSPASVELERRMRAAIAEPPYLGAERLIEHRDSAALGVAADDEIFMDYGHLNRPGAERQTRKLAATIRELGLLKTSGADGPVQP